MKRPILKCMVILVLLCSCTKSKQEISPSSSAFLDPQYEWGNFSGQTLTIWGRDTDLSRSYMLKAFKRYEELTGNIIETIPFSAEEFEFATATKLQDKTDAPDLILSFGGVNIDPFDPDDNFYDFTNAVWVEDLNDTSLNQAIYHGKVIGLPHWEASISGILYNKEIFHELKIDPPKTQQEFLQTCETLLQHGITPLYLPCETPSMFLYQFPLDIVVEEETILHSLNEGTLGYDGLPEMYTIVEWYRLMAQKGYLGDDYEKNNWDNMSSALSSRKYAMLLSWDTWLYVNFEGDPSDFGLMPAFIGVPEEGTFEGPNLSLLLVNKNSPQMDVAVDLITFMADPYNYNVAFEDIYTAPVFKNQLTQISTPQYVEAANWIEKNYHYSTAWLRIKGFSQTDASCIFTHMQNPEEYSVEQCLKDMEALRRGRIP